MTKYIDVYESEIDGIPCRIGVLAYTHVPAWSGNIVDCPSADDCYGYVEWDYDILTITGEHAHHLQDQITEQDETRCLKEYQDLLEGRYDGR